jgi:hypothetical protein
MSWMLFIDESGHDGRHSPYEVLAGLAVEDRALWRLIQALRSAQVDHFGIRLFDAYRAEAKGQKLLNRKTFRLAAQKQALDPSVRRDLAHQALTDGANVKGDQLTALGQAKLAYVAEALRLCRAAGAVAFASIIPNDVERPPNAFDFIRKDYAFLFERFFHFLNGHLSVPKPMGLIAFDELEQQQSQILLHQMERYFMHTNNGRTRSRLIVPEPFFVHSDLTTMIQMADLVAYTISWGVRLQAGNRPMTQPKRDELDPFATEVCRLRYHAATPGGYDTWGFCVIENLKAANDG